MSALITILWIAGVWISLYLIIRLILGIKRRKDKSPYYSDYYGR